MATDETVKVKVVFRKWANGDVIALFPDEEACAGYCQSYESLGQHAPAQFQGVIDATTEASVEEYTRLKRELERIGYEVEVAGA